MRSAPHSLQRTRHARTAASILAHAHARSSRWIVPRRVESAAHWRYLQGAVALAEAEDTQQLRRACDTSGPAPGPSSFVRPFTPHSPDRTHRSASVLFAC